MSTQRNAVPAKKANRSLNGKSQSATKPQPVPVVEQSLTPLIDEMESVNGGYIVDYTATLVTYQHLKRVTSDIFMGYLTPSIGSNDVLSPDYSFTAHALHDTLQDLLDRVYNERIEKEITEEENRKAKLQADLESIYKN